MAKWLLPVWVVVALVLLIGIIKEAYDKISDKGCAEWKDIICDTIGILIGVSLAVVMYIYKYKKDKCLKLCNNKEYDFRNS